MNDSLTKVPMARAEKRQLWCERITDWRASGLNQSAYCRRHHIALPQFLYWKRQLEAISPPEIGPVGQLRLVPLRPAKPAEPVAAGKGIIRLQAYGHTLEVAADTDLTRLRDVLDLLEARACGM